MHKKTKVQDALTELDKKGGLFSQQNDNQVLHEFKRADANDDGGLGGSIGSEQLSENEGHRKHPIDLIQDLFFKLTLYFLGK